MIGQLNPNDKRVTVIGAGISGLLIGYALKKKGYQVTIHEKTNRCGGLIETRHTPYGMVETAAHSILVNEPVKQFLDELGVELLSINPDSKARYIYRRGKMRRMPLNFFEIISTLFHFFRKPKLTKSLSELSLGEWGDAYLGKAATRFLLSPFTTGVFACLPEELNARLSFPKLLPESPNQSLFQHMQMMVFKNGTEELIHQLESKLKDNIRFNSTITDLQSIEGNVVVSVPATDLQYSPLITATVFMHKNSFKTKPPRGVGVLVPRGENIRMLGCLFNSSAFQNRIADQNTVSLTVMYGGTADPSALELSEVELKSLIEKELKMLLRTQESPIHLEITRWQRAIPIYSSHLSQYIDNLSQAHYNRTGRLIFSNFSGQVSIRGMIETVLKI